MTRWEYYSATSITAVGTLDNLGANGWQLCAVNDGFFIFKRPKEEQPMNTSTETPAVTLTKNQALPAGIWRHYKGGHYQVLGIAAHSETNEPMVVYVSLDGLHLPGPRMRVRPLSMWFDRVPFTTPDGINTERSRFTYIGPELPRV